MRIAFFGGSFDPPHRGHLAIARAAVDCVGLDRVLFAPVGTQPLKRDLQPAAFEDRLAMVRLAIEGESRFDVSLIDAPRADGKPNFTLHTLRTLRRSLAPEDELFCLLGADSFLSIRQWKGADDLLFACDFIVAGRPGFELTNLRSALPEDVLVTGTPRLFSPGCLSVGLESRDRQRSRLYLLPDLKEDISATEIRAALNGPRSQAADEHAVLPAAVIAYIRAQDLYR